MADDESSDEPRPGDPLLVVEDLVVGYGGVIAVRAANLVVRRGEVVALLGPNGAGKSSTLNAIVGYTPARSGRVVFDGEAVMGKPPESLTRRGLVLVPEGRRIFGSLTVEENLRVGAAFRKDRAAVREDLENILSLFPTLGRYFRSRAGNLSGGEQQQVAIARALMAHPTLLLLDEPSLGLAPILVEQVFLLLRKLRSLGRAMLLVEQNVASAIALADRAYVMSKGHIEVRQPVELT